MKVWIIAVSLLLLNSAYVISAPIYQIEVGKNQRITSQQKNLHHVESDIFINPGNSNHWLVAAIIYTDPVAWEYHCATWVTTNAGKSWKRTDFLASSADPQVIMDSNNNAYLSCLGKSNERGEVYYTSDNGGQSWSDVKRIPGGHDHPFMTLFDDTIVWVSTTNRNTDLNFRKAVNGGEFIEQSTLDFPASKYRHDNFKHTVLSDGTLLVPFVKYYTGERGPETEGAFLVTSKDDGKTLSKPTLITNTVGSAKGLSSLHADISNTATKDNLYFIYGKGVGRNESLGVAVSISEDRGESWKEVMIQLPEPRGNSFLNPTAAVNKDGVLAVHWVEKRNDPQRVKDDIYFTASLDGGKTFLEPVRITEVSSNLIKNRGGQKMAATFRGGGHYQDMVALPDGSFQLIWSDARSGIYQLYTANVTVKK